MSPPERRRKTRRGTAARSGLRQPRQAVPAPAVRDWEFRETTESLRPFDQSVKVNLQGTVTICDDERATDVAALIPPRKKRPQKAAAVKGCHFEITGPVMELSIT